MIRERPDRWPSDKPSFVMFLAKNGGISDETKKYRDIVIQWFQSQDEVPKAQVVQFCVSRIEHDIRKFKDSLLKGLKIFRDWSNETDAKNAIFEITKLLRHVQTASDLTVSLNREDQLQQLQQLIWEIWDLFQTTSAYLKTMRGDIRNRFPRASGRDKLDRVDALECLNLLEDLVRLPHALKELAQFRRILQGNKAILQIELVDIRIPEDEGFKKLETKKLKELRHSHPALKVRIPKLNIRPPRAHCEMQLLAHLQKLNLDEQDQVWRFISCSKLPCFCCFDFAHNFKMGTQKSHFKVYYPWPVPSQLVVSNDFEAARKSLAGHLAERTQAANQNNGKFVTRRQVPEVPPYLYE
ncbi:hypothetical protein GGR57DRAFT_503590 [Xylariaceae sp. FL1272]|nr:hypothetical protein GGR57DRAFT_503590 [Xylariaceae sp. FL1272]